MADRFDTLSLPFLRALRGVAEKADAASCPVTVCGEMAGRPIDALALIGLGFRSLSMSAVSIGPVKAAVLALPCADLAELVARTMSSGTGDNLRPILSEFAARHGIAG